MASNADTGASCWTGGWCRPLVATWHQALRMNSPAVSSLEAFRTPAAVHPLAPAPGRHPKTLNETGLFTPRLERGRASNFAGDSAEAERSAAQHAHPHRRSASSTEAFPHKADGFLPRLAILCARKASSESPLWLHVKSRQRERQHLRHVATQSERRPVNRRLHPRC